MREALLLTLIVATASTTPGDSGREASPDGQWLREWLVLEPTGRRGRDPIQVDGLTYELARAGSLRPVVGGRVVSVDGEQRQWSTATAGEDGWLQGPALRGGHAAVAVRSEAPRTVLLEATGHSVVYCNGVPRAGDPYGTGFVRLPVRLHAGDNTLLFRVGRGRVRARLMPLRAEALLNAGDMTLPDAVVGEGGDLVGAGVVINGSSQRLNDAWIVAQVDGAEPVRTAVPSIERLTVRKVAFRFQVPPGAPPGELALRIQLHRGADEADPPLDSADVKVQVRSADEVYKRTFVSAIDGGVQYYAVRRATEAGQQGLFLTLHGASVEAVGQDRAYASKSWGHIVAPTNRRPFGFDWEDWGRWDALEVLEHASDTLDIDPARVYLTGHSMGGHGTWHVGVTFPDRFAAIGPSAGWASFWSYAGSSRPDPTDPIAAIFRRSTMASDTIALAENLQRLGVYVLHGADDDNVPVSEARRMRTRLAEFHPDFVYHEQPGAGHWWGNQCVDWPEMFEFFENRRRTPVYEVRNIRFQTASPGVSARSDWVTVGMQQESLRRSLVDISLDAEARRFSGHTKNVNRLVIELNLLSVTDDEGAAGLPVGSPVEVALDGHTLTDVAWPGDGKLRLRNVDGTWTVAERAPSDWKGPHRYGPFKNVFRNNVVFVYGTVGSDAENAWAYAKARYDAETFWYRGNGAIELRPDVEYDHDAYRGRNVVLYGNADTNAAWAPLLKTSPVQLGRDVVRIGDRTWTGGDLAMLLVRPVPGDERALVGVVGGTGLVGMRATVALPYFVSGVGYPDCTILRADALRRGLEGVVTAGSFGERWEIEAGAFPERTAGESEPDDETP